MVAEGERLTPEQMREELDRKPPLDSCWHDFDENGEPCPHEHEHEVPEVDEQMEAGHA